MAEEVKVGCARPTDGPVGEPVEEAAEEKSKPVEKEISMIHVGEKVPDFVAPGYHQGKFINVIVRLPGEVDSALFLPRRFHLCLSDRAFGGRREIS